MNCAYLREEERNPLESLENMGAERRNFCTVSLMHVVLVLTVQWLSTLCSADHGGVHGSAKHRTQPIDANCSHLLFVYFGGEGAPGEAARYAWSSDGFHWNMLNGNKPVLVASVAGTSIRDPFVHLGPDGRFHMVATNGARFGGTPTILYWSSDDLVTWSSEQVLPVMQNVSDGLQSVWAPEWVWAPERKAYLVFWAARFADGHTHEDELCSNPERSRFKFWSSWTTDWSVFSTPTILYDPGCNQSGYAPYNDSVGGIDGDIVQLADGSYVFYYKDSRGYHGPDVQLHCGDRYATSSQAGGPYSVPSAMVSPYGAEGPELIYFNDHWLLFYDCSFHPTPAGYPRPPYGVSVSDTAVGMEWQEVKGSCTGNSTDVLFPRGATHGSFVCLSDQLLQPIVKKWG